MKNVFNCYFGAANGFSGFRSYFHEIFSVKDFTRIYVIKGGPGTGKSSLMKRLGAYFGKCGLPIDRIYCSSDPNSLDGVIIYNDNKKIAVLDGTAPHETDAKVPGAVDEIINLGEMWDKDKLINQRNVIEILTERKKLSYQKAYKYLREAGHFYDDVYSITCKAFNNSDAVKKIDDFFNFKPINQSRKITKRLISSFSKYGYKTVDILQNASLECISVKGSFGSEYAFMNAVKDSLIGKNYDLLIFPSPYSDSLTEAIYIPSANQFISINSEANKEIDSKIFLNKNTLDDYNDLILNFKKCYTEMLNTSKTELEKASDAHFLLEAIYTPAMDFEILNKKTDGLIKDISQTLESAE